METPSCRQYLVPFCTGSGLDIGFGGIPIVPTAICIDRSEGNPLRCNIENPNPTHLVGDADKLYWFRDETLDYVFSSHCLEDFKDTLNVLQEWWRVIKVGGNLILFLPDEITYRNYCSLKKTNRNLAHAHADFSLKNLKPIISSLKGYHIVHELWPFPTNPYSFSLVAKKMKSIHS